MTGLLYHRLIKLTAKVNLLYLVYVMTSLFFSQFPFTYTWQKSALVLFMINMSIHARLGLWAVITDYIPEKFQSFMLRFVEIYLLLILIWVIILICL